MDLSIRAVIAVLELLGIDRSHGTIYNWTHTLSKAQSDPPTAVPLRVAVDEKQIEVDGEKKGGTLQLTSNQAPARNQGLQPPPDSPRRRSCIGLPRNTITTTQRFSSVLAAIGLSSLRLLSLLPSRQSSQFAAGSDGSGTVTTTIDQIERSMTEHQPRSCSTRQY